jgi:hypothetical protein
MLGKYARREKRILATGAPKSTKERVGYAA